MEKSPAGRDIEELEGNPFAIENRGREIEELGQKMIDSADVLQQISSRADAGQGKAIDKLRDKIGSSHETLKEAGELYKPVGPIIAAYGETLTTLKYQLNGSVSSCELLWAAYAALEGDENGPLTAAGDATPQETEEAENNAAKLQAYESWVDAAEGFDRHYDTWEEAFETAASGIEQEMGGKIEDGGWREFFQIAGTVLGWAGLIVGVIAIFVGGPFIVALAGLISVLALVVAVVQALDPHNKAGWGAVALALVDFVPFGKLGRLFRKLPDGALNKVDDLFDGNALNPRTYSKLFDEGGEALFKLNKGPGNWLSKLFTGKTADDWGSTANKFFDFDSTGSIFKDFFKGAWTGLTQTPGFLLEAGSTVAGNGVTVWGWVNRITGEDSPKSQYPGLVVL